MVGCESEAKAILAKVIADGDLAAEGVTPSLKAEAIKIVGECLHEDRDLKTGEANRISYSFFIAKIRQADKNSRDAIRILLEELAATFGIGPITIKVTGLGDCMITSITA